MQSPPPTTSYADSGLLLLLLIAAIVTWSISPAKWQTFKKMAVASLALFAMVIGLGLVMVVLGYSNAGFGKASVLCAIIAALVIGRQHVGALKKQLHTSKPPAP
jgi:hypothetical protein